MTRIVFDGWPLVHAPDSPAGLHLLALLEYLPGSIEAILALPGMTPEWLAGLLAGLPRPVQVVQHRARAGNEAWGRLGWEQQTLPRLAAARQAGGLHACGNTAPLMSRTPVSLSPAWFAEAAQPRGAAARLQQAAGQGGAGQARVVRPADLPEKPGTAVCPPFTSRIFNTQASGEGMVDLAGNPVNLPETYVLYHGPGSEAALHRLLSAWSWAAGPVGDVYPLVAVGLDAAGRRLLEELAQEYRVSDSVVGLETLPPVSAARVYQGCAVVFHPAQPAAWGDPLLNGLACGKPVVSIESAETDARLGAAGYLAPAQDSRALGAALLSVLVEESVQELLSSASVTRRMTWGDAAAGLEKVFN